MAGLIVKSPYLKCGGKGGTVSGYMGYIATRERVQKLADSRNLFEYEDWQTAPTRANASAFITTALECNWQAAVQSELYLRYIATRPRAERLGSHGLFGDSNGVELEKAMSELDSFTGNVWTHIFSLKRCDAQRLGYDSADSWRNLLRAHRGEIAAAMDIPPGDFCWYAAFHDEGEHPHVHMMAWSASQQKPGYLTREGIKAIRSKLTNEIFKQELLHTYEQKSASRDELVRQARRELLALVHTMQTGLCDHPEVETLMLQLAQGLETARGKKSYGYLPKPLKALTDQIVGQMERIPAVAQYYERWQTLQNQVQGYYSDRELPRLPLSRQREFQAVKNAAIREAERIRTGEITFEDEGVSEVDEPESNRYTAEFYRQYRDRIYNTDLPLDERDYAVEQMAVAAKAGNLYAQHLLGKLYRDGTVVIPDAEKARGWFLQAAEQGLNVARYALGKLLLTDDPLVRDIPAGLRWLEQAHQNGSSYAGYRLGKEHMRGKIVPKDVPKALDYLNNAAQKGNQFAQYTLGKLYLLGRGVPQDKASWVSFFQWLKGRGLEGVKLVVGDKCLGMLEAVGEVYPDAKYQRCTVHFYRNIFSTVPNSKGKLVAKMLKAIHAQESKAAALAKARDVVASLREMKLKEAAKKIEDSVEETLTYMTFPYEHWTRIHINNAIERLNREIRRRTRVVGAFPDGNSALVLVCARLRHVAGTQWGNKKYMNMKHLEAALDDASIAG